MTDVVLLIFYFVLAVGMSFVCSVLEAVLLSVRPTFVEQMNQNRVRGAGAWEKLRDKRSDALAAILILNTVAHTFGAAGVGAEAKVVFESIPIGFISAILTILILVLSEIIPKTLGAHHWRSLAPICGVTLVWLVRAMYPLIKMSQWITTHFQGNKDGGELSRAEIEAMIELGQTAGTLDTQESHVMRSVIRLQTVRIRHIMTPRTVVFSAPESMTVGQFIEAHGTTPFSRVPVYTRTPDELSGFVLTQDILLSQVKGHADWPLSQIRRAMQNVPEQAPVWPVFEQLASDRDHIRAVRDEFGGVAGIVTLEDVVETLLGMEIIDEADRDVDMRAKARRLWKARAAEKREQTTPVEPSASTSDPAG